MKLEEYINRQKKRIEQALHKYLPSPRKYPPIIHKAMRYSVFSGGKRIRPVMTITTFEACGGEDGKILPVACAIELIHTYSLIHDDLPAMDNDDFRRGKPSCHKKFSPAIAILAGSALLTQGFNLLTYLDNPNIVKKLVSYISSKVGSFGMLGGQIVDVGMDSNLIGSEKVNNRLKTKILRKSEYINTHKAGALIQAALISGAITAEVDQAIINVIEKYGYYVGYLFQIVDDILDKDGYVALWGQDEAINKAKNLLIKAKQQSTALEKRGYILTQLADYIFAQLEKIKSKNKPNLS